MTVNLHDLIVEATREALDGLPANLSGMGKRQLMDHIKDQLTKIVEPIVSFSHNDKHIRDQVRSSVGSLLRDIQSRGGVVNYKTICDETNNTADVIGAGEFVATVYVQLTQTVNFIQLDMNVSRHGVQFP